LFFQNRTEQKNEKTGLWSNYVCLEINRTGNFPDKRLVGKKAAKKKQKKKKRKKQKKRTLHNPEGTALLLQSLKLFIENSFISEQ